MTPADPSTPALQPVRDCLAALLDVTNLEVVYVLSRYSLVDFDPAALDVERLANDLAALAKRWSRSPTPSRKRST